MSAEHCASFASADIDSRFSTRAFCSRARNDGAGGEGEDECVIEGIRGKGVRGGFEGIMLKGALGGIKGVERLIEAGTIDEGEEGDVVPTARGVIGGEVEMVEPTGVGDGFAPFVAPTVCRDNEGGPRKDEEACLFDNPS